MSKELKALEILKHYTGSVAPITLTPKVIAEAIKELEELEYEDRLAELEKVILDYYLAKGYQIGVGHWDFNVEIDCLYKSKTVKVKFVDFEIEIDDFIKIETITTKEMFDKAIKCFSTRQNEVIECNQTKS